MEQVISRDGTPIAFWKSGSGPSLLLVHGTTADHTRWTPILPEFERDFTVYLVDRRGRGGSGDSDTYHILREAEDIAAVVDALVPPVFLVGHSYGGLCSLEASLLTRNLSRLVVYEPPIPTDLSIAPPGVPARMNALLDQGDLEGALEVMVREVMRMPEEELAKYRRLPVWQRRIALAPTIPRELELEQTYRFEPERFADVRVPAMVLLGGDSPAVFRRAAQLAASALPNGRLVTLPGQRHVAMDTDPDLFVREVRGFLLERGAAGGSQPAGLSNVGGSHAGNRLA